jgi:hypothetical protein
MFAANAAPTASDDCHFLGFQERVAQLLAEFQVGFGAAASQPLNALDVAGSLHDAQRAPAVQQVEGMGALQRVFKGREDQTRIQNSFRFPLKHLKEAKEHVGVGKFKVVNAAFVFRPLVQFP